MLKMASRKKGTHTLTKKRGVNHLQFPARNKTQKKKRTTAPAPSFAQSGRR